MRIHFCLGVAALGLTAFASAAPTYIALGDSVAFGYQDGDIIPSYGVQGYVDDVAAALNAKTGTTHTVLNLAVPEETSVSFGDTSVGIARALNLNYDPGALNGHPVSQLSMLQTSIGTVLSSGNTVDTVSFAIGANDILDLTNEGTTIPTQTQIDTAVAGVQARYLSVLSYLHSTVPSATILLPGYYNPFGKTTSNGAALDPLILQFNQGVQTLAGLYGAKYVDFYDVIDGHQSTLIGSGIHPNTAGYDALGRVAAQAVPEPGTFAALGLGALALLRRRKR